MASTERATLNRELIAERAMELLDTDGLDGLSMRKLGAALGVEAMSLYHYIQNKDDLLDAIVENLYGELELPTDIPAEDWEHAFRIGLRSFYDVLLRHPAALTLFTTRPAEGENALAVMSWAYERCRMAGLDAEQAAETFHICVAYVIGHVATELGLMARINTGVGLDGLPQVDGDPGFLTFLSHVADTGAPKVFETGLDLLFTALISTYGLESSRRAG